GLPVADGVLGGTRSGEALGLVGVGGGSQGRLALAEKSVAQIVVGLAAAGFVALDESAAIGFGGAFVIAEAVGRRADAHVQTGAVGGGEAFGQGTLVGLDGTGDIVLLIGFVAVADAVAGEGRPGGKKECP